MSEHNFEIKNKQKSDLPDFLEKGQNDALQTHTGNPGKFNRNILVDAFSNLRTPEKVNITITDDSTVFSVSTITTDNRTPPQEHWISRHNLFQTREGTSQ
jgi:hypothetical protein